MNISIPADFGTRMSAFPGGAQWLTDLPDLAAACAERWSLKLQPPFPLSLNYVCPVQRSDGSIAVLKIGPATPEFLCEQAALRFYDGAGCARLLEAAPELGATLLERLAPGTMLSELADDEEATRIAASLMAELWRPAPAREPFPSIEDWARGLERLRTAFGGGTGPFSREMVETAEALFAELLPSQGERVLLHGDLHHFNILQAKRDSWRAIDPKGLIGEREAELAPLLYNPDLETLDHPALRRLTLRRIDQLAEFFGFDRRRVYAWAYAQSVLSSWWSCEDNDPEFSPAPRIAEVLADLI